MLYIEQYSRPNVFVANSVFTVANKRNVVLATLWLINVICG